MEKLLMYITFTILIVVLFEKCKVFSSAQKQFKNVVIVEVKQEKQNTRTPIYSILKSNRIRTVSFSKYCMGVSTVFTDIKSNKFKELNLKINHLNN